MRKKLKFLTIISLFLIIATPTVNASKDLPTLGELKETYQQKLKEKEEAEKQSEAAKQEIKEKEAAIKKAEQEIHAAEEEEQRVQKEIEESNEKIKESNEKIEKLTKDTEAILMYLQQVQGGNAYVEYVSGATTVTEMINRIAGLEFITEHTRDTMKELEEEVKKLEEEVKKNEQLKQELIEKQKRLEAQAAEYKKVIEARYKDVSNYDKYALGIEEQIPALKIQLDDAISRCEKYAPEKKDDAIVNIDCVKKTVIDNGSGSNIVIENGAWLKPLNSGTVTSQVGARWGSYHNALDIGGPSPFEGTPVYAAAAGVVSGKINQYSCGGNMLYIDVVVDGKPYTTYYYHLLKFNVNVGDVVTQNTIIGWVGGYSTSTVHGGYDSCTTGAHLHFGVATGFYNGYSIPRSNVITPPGFANRYGYRFNSRYDMYQG